MTTPRYLTKSRFKLGCECPTKLFYTRKKEYPDNKLDDPFLAALADGGYQVGTLSTLEYPGGHDVQTLDYEDAIKETDELLQQENVVIFEPAIRYQNLFIRVDILVKQGNNIRLIEVKAKSIDPSNRDPFLTKKGVVTNIWKPYLFDVAFQTYVMRQAMPECTIEPFLKLVNKKAKCKHDLLHQKFRITKDANGRKGVKVNSSLSTDDFDSSIMIEIPVDSILDTIYNNSDEYRFDGLDFIDNINFLAQAYENDEKIPTPIGKQCKTCEFKYIAENPDKDDKKSGFKECWQEQLDWTEEDFNEPNVLQINNFRKNDEFLEFGKIKLTDLIEEDIDPHPDEKPGLSLSERQWLQVKKAQDQDNNSYLDQNNLKDEISTWTFPLHFIDFETSAVAIPFHKGRRPYEGIAFQFSHHTVDKNGKIEHAGEYLSREKGVFPNFIFIRELMAQLNNDKGTIFRYSNHENTYLNFIYRQLKDSAETDRTELMNFIKTITTSVDTEYGEWEGERNMVDLWHLVKRYYYDPYTKGSNSIKYVLPAILNSSQYLQNKYSQPIYGSKNGIKSLNFENQIWIKKNNGIIQDPYCLLPKIFSEISDKNQKMLLTESNELKDGGAALTAYARMQFEEMSDEENDALAKSLLKYCELDTLAMVMIYEGWREMLTLN